MTTPYLHGAVAGTMWLAQDGSLRGYVVTDSYSRLAQQQVLVLPFDHRGVGLHEEPMEASSLVARSQEVEATEEADHWAPQEARALARRLQRMALTDRGLAFREDGLWAVQIGDAGGDGEDFVATCDSEVTNEPPSEMQGQHRSLRIASALNAVAHMREPEHEMNLLMNELQRLRASAVRFRPVAELPSMSSHEYGWPKSEPLYVGLGSGEQIMATCERMGPDEPVRWRTADSERWDVTDRVVCWAYQVPLDKSFLPAQSPSGPQR